MNFLNILRKARPVPQFVIMATAVFLILLWAVELPRLIIVLNGIFCGAIVAILIAYWSLITGALLGRHPYDRVRQMTLGFFLCWVTICLNAAASVYLSSIGGASPPPVVLAALARFIAIIAAVLQVTAPDFGLGLFHGRDRKTLWATGTIGGVVSVVVIVAQMETVLSGF